MSLVSTFQNIVLISLLLINRSKIRHPHVHNMGDAGEVIAGPIGRELLFWGSVLVAILAQGSHLLAGARALQAFSNNSLCSLLYTGIFAAAVWHSISR